MFSSQTNSAATMESLETRQLLSSVVVPTAIEGTYKGTAFYSDGSRAIKLVISAKTQKLTVADEGSASQKLTAAKIEALEAGTFAYTGSIHGDKLVLNGTLSDGVITGTFTGKGALRLLGTFSLTKV